MSNAVRIPGQRTGPNLILGRLNSGGGLATPRGISITALATAIANNGALPLPSAGTSLITSVDSNFTVTVGGALQLHTAADKTLISNISGSTGEPVANTGTAFLDEVFGNTEGNILQRGASAWQVLAPGTANQVLISGGASALNSWDGLSALLDTMFGNTEGQILQRGTSAWQVLAPGTNGQVLTSGGAGALNSWAAASGGTTISDGGAWSGTAGYTVGQCVRYNSSAYLCYVTVAAPTPGTVTLDPTNKQTGITLSGSNLAATVGGTLGGGTSQTGVTATAGAANKVYFEVTGSSLSGNTSGVGISIVSPALAFTTAGQFFNADALGAIYNGNTSTGYSFAGWTNGRKGAIAIDFGAQLFWVTDDATSTTRWNQGTTGAQNPATGAGGIPFWAGFNGLAMLPCYQMQGGSGEGWTFNLGASAFSAALPTGFVSWNTLAAASPNISPDKDDVHWEGQGAIVIGTTEVALGTTQQLLYDNAGVVGEVTKANNGLLVTSGAGVPSIGTAVPNGVTATTQSAGDNTTKLATDQFVTTAIANAIAGVNPAVAVQAATTAAADTSSYVYNNGVSGIGATLTGPTNNVAVTIDGFTFTALGQRLLVKNDTQSPSGAFNGVYYVTQLQGTLLKPILTRALDYDQSSDINNTGAIPVVNGTVNALTSWLLTSQVTTVGTDPLTYAQFSSATIPVAASPITNSLSGNVTLSGSNVFNNGPMVAQGSTGTWFASGTCTVINTGGADTITGKLWDGTTVIASCRVTTPGASFAFAMSLSGYIASPAGNIRFDVAGGNASGGLILANNSGLGKDSTITAYRIA